MTLELQHLDHVAITVSDIPASIDWYTSVLGLEHRPIVEWGEYPQMVCAGETCLALFPASVKAPKPLSDAERQSRATMRHFAFRVDRANFERAQGRFKELGIECEFADHGVAHSIYIADPDGHTIELTTYEV